MMDEKTFFQAMQMAGPQMLEPGLLKNMPSPGNPFMQSMAAAPPQPAQPNVGAGLLNNPFLQMGLGIMGANSGPGTAGSFIGRGALGGLRNQQQYNANMLAQQAALMKALKPGEFQQQLQAYQANPDLISSFFRAKNPGTSVSVDVDTYNPDEARVEDLKGRDEWARGQLKSLWDAAAEAPASNENLKLALGYLDTVYTGPASEQYNWLLKVANAMGITVDQNQILGFEHLQTFMGDEIMKRIQQTKGAVSNKEMELFKEYGPNLTKSQAGNRAIIQWEILKNERAIRLADMAHQMMREGKRSWEIERAVQQELQNSDMSQMLRDALGQVQTEAAGPVTQQSIQGELQRRRTPGGVTIGEY